MDALLKNAIQTEQDTIIKYRCQAEKIRDAYVVDILRRIILDEQLHVRIFQEMLREVLQEC